MISIFEGINKVGFCEYWVYWEKEEDKILKRKKREDLKVIIELEWAQEEGRREREVEENMTRIKV